MLGAVRFGRKKEQTDERVLFVTVYRNRFGDLNLDAAVGVEEKKLSQQE